MLIKKKKDIPSREITDKKVYMGRRAFLQGAALATTVLATGAFYRFLNPWPAVKKQGKRLTGVIHSPDVKKFSEALTPLQDITSYNNFYEFSTSKGQVAESARNFVTRPWTLMVDGMVNKPRRFDLDELQGIAPLEERIYRLRCVERWSMVIPWIGFPLRKLLDHVEPQSTARYVAFETLYDPEQMPNQNTGILQWPYVEGLRLDEALHPLTLLATGLYGETLLPQNGAPIRLVVPWKYGFKSIKSIVRIRLLDSRPPTTWNLFAPNEYGFYSNVNPNVDHARWSQAKERRIGEFDLRDTSIFNGYADEVGHLYSGMDLKKYF